MIWTLSWVHLSPSKNKKGMFTKRYYRVHLLLIIIPLWINNYKTETVYPSGDVDKIFS